MANEPTLTIHTLLNALLALAVTVIMAIQAFIGTQVWEMNGRLFTLEATLSNQSEFEKRLDRVERHVAVCEQMMIMDPDSHQTPGFQRP